MSPPGLPRSRRAAANQCHAAYADLARLDLVQLTLQAVCYAAYANELLGLELRGEDVLAFWSAAFVRRGLSKETA